MMYYGSVAEGLAYLRVNDDAWAEYAAALNAAAVKRGQDEAAAEDST